MELSLGVIIMHMVVYIAAIFILKILYFDPVLKLIKRREALTKGKESSTEEMLKKIEEFKIQYQSEVTQLKKQLDEQREKSLSQAKEEGENLIERVRNESETQLKEHQQKLDEQIEKIQQKLPDLGSQLGDEIVDVVMNSRVTKAN